MSDKMQQLADDLMLARVAHLNVAGDAVVWHNKEVEALIRTALKPLLEAIVEYMLYGSLPGTRGVAAKERLAAELQHWTGRTPDER